MGLLYLYLFIRWGGWSTSRSGNFTPSPHERPGTHCIGSWVGPRAGLDGCGKSRPHQDATPGPSSPQPVAIPTELSHRTLYSLCSFYSYSTKHLLQTTTATVHELPHFKSSRDVTSASTKNLPLIFRVRFHFWIP